MAAVAAAATSASSVPAAAPTNTNTNTNSNANNNNNLTMVTESQLRIDALSASLGRLSATTSDLSALTRSFARRARHLDSLTSPASETSAMLTQSAANLAATLGRMREAREKFDTVQDCEPAIRRLHGGAREAVARFEASGGARAAAAAANSGSGDAPMAAVANTAGGGSGGDLTEQDVYAAVDSMDIVRDAHAYFLPRAGSTGWASAPAALGGLERSHALGVDAMCLLIGHHLQVAGAAVKPKTLGGGGGGKKKGGGGRATIADLQSTGAASANANAVVSTSRETAAETRLRLSAALQKRDLMASVGECAESLPLDSRPVRELRAVFECLGGEAAHLGPDPMGMVRRSRGMMQKGGGGGAAGARVVRTEKVGSGGYCGLVNVSARTCSNAIH